MRNSVHTNFPAIHPPAADAATPASTTASLAGAIAEGIVAGMDDPERVWVDD